jgi:hypothetical protein
MYNLIAANIDRSQVSMQASRRNQRADNSRATAVFLTAGCRRSALYISSSVICQTTGPKPLQKRFLHLMRSRASTFK